MTSSEDIIQFTYRIESVHLLKGKTVDHIIVAITSKRDNGTEMFYRYSVGEAWITRLNPQPHEHDQPRVYERHIPFIPELWANAVAGNPNTGVLQKRFE